MQQILNGFFETIQAIIESVFDFVIGQMHAGKNTEYDAGFASPSDMLSRHGKGFSFGNRSLSISESLKHAILYGPSGSGKSTSVLAMCLLRTMGAASIIVNDPSGQLLKWFGSIFKLFGYHVEVVNWANPKCGGYNPLSRIKTNSDIQKLSKLLILNALGEAKEMFWNLSSEALLACIIKLVVRYQPKEVQNLYNVLYLVNLLSFDPAKVDVLFIRTKDDSLIAEYKSFVSYDSRTLSNIIASIKAALSVFSSEEVALATSYDTIDIERCRTQKTKILYKIAFQI